MYSTATASSAAACSCGRDLAAARTVLSLADSSKGSMAPLSPRSRACGLLNPQGLSKNSFAFGLVRERGGEGGGEREQRREHTCRRSVRRASSVGLPDDETQSLSLGMPIECLFCNACRRCISDAMSQACDLAGGAFSSYSLGERRFLFAIAERTCKVCPMNDISVIQTLTFRCLRSNVPPDT